MQTIKPFDIKQNSNMIMYDFTDILSGSFDEYSHQFDYFIKI